MPRPSPRSHSLRRCSGRTRGDVSLLIIALLLGTFTILLAGAADVAAQSGGPRITFTEPSSLIPGAITVDDDHTVEFEGTASPRPGATISTIELSSDRGATWTEASWTPAQDDSEVEWSLQFTLPNGKYRIYGRVIDSTGASTVTDHEIVVKVRDTVPPPAVTNLTARPRPNGDIALHWDTFSAEETVRLDIADLRLYMSDDQPTSLDDMVLYSTFIGKENLSSEFLAEATNKTIQASNLREGEEYWFALTTLDQFGNENRTDVEFASAVAGAAEEESGAGELCFILLPILIVVVVALILIFYFPTESGSKLKKALQRVRTALRPYVYVMPALAALAILTFYPVGYGFYLSVMNVQGSNYTQRDEWKFVGGKHYVDIFAPPEYIWHRTPKVIWTEPELLNNTVVEILATEEEVYIGCINGTSVFDRTTGAFDPLRAIEFEEIPAIGAAARLTALELVGFAPNGPESSQLAIGTTDGLFLFATASPGADPTVIDSADGLPSTTVTALASADTDNDGAAHILSIGTDAGAAQYNLDTGRIEAVWSAADGLPSDTVTVLTRSGSDLVVGTDTGLAIIDLETDTMEVYGASDLGEGYVTALAPYRDVISIGTLGGGIVNYNRYLGTLEREDALLGTTGSSGLDKATLESRNITTLFADERSELLYIGTSDRGVYRYNITLGVFLVDSTNRNWDRVYLESATVNTIEVGNGHIYVGTVNGTPVYNTTSQSFRRSISGKSEGTTDFWLVLKTTMIWTVSNILAHVGLGMMFAVILNRKIRGKILYRTLLLLPWAVPAYISCLIWKGMFNYNYGAINHVIGLMGFEKVPWLGEMPYALVAVIIVNIWLGFPFMMMVFSGGLQSIPEELYEAASVDGVSRWSQFRHITLPLLRPTVVPAALLGFIWTFNMFNVIYLVTGGGPAAQTDILITYVYDRAFIAPNYYSFAAAYSVVIFFMLVGFSLTFTRINKSMESAY